MIRRPPSSPLFPYPPLSRYVYDELERRAARLETGLAEFGRVQRVGGMLTFFCGDEPVTSFRPLDTEPYEDRKSTRLNSSHANISYAVFCLQKINSSL